MGCQSQFAEKHCLRAVTHETLYHDADLITDKCAPSISFRTDNYIARKTTLILFNESTKIIMIGNGEMIVLKQKLTRSNDK